MAKVNKASVRFLRAVIGGQKGLLATVTVIGVFLSLLTCFSALLTKGAIDAALGSGNITSLLIIYGCYVAATTGLQLLYSYLMSRLGLNVELLFRSKIYDFILGKDYSALAKYHSGDVLNRATSDVNVISVGVSQILPYTLAYITKILASFALLLYLDWQMAVLVLVAAPVTVLGARYFGAKVKRAHRLVQESESENKAFLIESVQNMSVIKAFGSNQTLREYFDGLQKKNYKSKHKSLFLSVLAGLCMFASVTVVYYIALILGIYKLSVGAIAYYGTFTAILQLVVQFQTPFSGLATEIMRYYKTSASAERVRELSNLPEAVQYTASNKEIVKIIADDVSYEYDNGCKAIQGLSFEIKAGECVGIIGASGAGKTTLLKLMVGLLTASSGSIKCVTNDGEESAAGPYISYVPQTNMVLSGTVADNITLFNKGISDKAIARAVEMSCLSEMLSELPAGLNTMIGERGANISEGQAERLAIARAIAAGKRVLLLDEATADVDEKLEDEIISRLKSGGYTIILVTHHSRIYDRCDKLINIK